MTEAMFKAATHVQSQAVRGTLMSLSSLVTALLNDSVPNEIVLAVLFVFGASAIGWNGVYLAEVARQAPPGMASVATGGTLAITFCGVVFGPALFGALSGIAGSYAVGFAAIGLSTALCCVSLWIGRRPIGLK